MNKKQVNLALSLIQAVSIAATAVVKYLGKEGK